MSHTILESLIQYKTVAVKQNLFSPYLKNYFNNIHILQLVQKECEIYYTQICKIIKETHTVII